MNKRLLKRHKRQVARAKDRKRLSEPDLRTPEQVRAAREAGRAATDRRTGAHPRHSTSPAQSNAADAALQPAPGRSISTGADTGGAADHQRKGGGGGPQGPFEPGKEVM
jgi:hypothetical protein